MQRVAFFGYSRNKVTTAAVVLIFNMCRKDGYRVDAAAAGGDAEHTHPFIAGLHVLRLQLGFVVRL